MATITGILATPYAMSGRISHARACQGVGAKSAEAIINARRMTIFHPADIR